MRVVAGLVFSLLLSTVVLDATPAATAGEPSTNCVRGEPEPLLRPARKGAGAIFRRTGPLDAVETVRVERGTDLTIRHAGCAHFALEFEFVTRTGGPPTPSVWLARAARWLRALPVLVDQKPLVERLARRLQEAARERYAFGLPLQMSEMETVTVERQRDGSRTRLVLVYDVAL